MKPIAEQFRDPIALQLEINYVLVVSSIWQKVFDQIEEELNNGLTAPIELEIIEEIETKTK